MSKFSRFKKNKMYFPFYQLQIDKFLTIPKDNSQKKNKTKKQNYSMFQNFNFGRNTSKKHA